MNHVHVLTGRLSSSQRLRRASRRHHTARTGTESVPEQRLVIQAYQLEEKQRQIEELEAANAELRMFAAMAAHDLKSPLTTIFGFAVLAEDKLANVDAEPVRACLRSVRTAAERMSRLVVELQDLASLGRPIDEPAEVPLDEVVAEAVEQLAGPIAERGVEIEVAPALPVVVADRLALARVVQNLIENGIRYMGAQPRPRIEISARVDGKTVLCNVRDNGAGIAREHQKRVFEPFEKLGGKGGNGLGLFIVRRIVEAHGGRIWVESDGEGSGSSFCFTLRAAAEPRRDDRL